MYCPHCGKAIADEAVVCIGCGRPVTPLKPMIPFQYDISAGAKDVHTTARAFLVGGILNVLVGLLVTPVWIFGLLAAIVGIVELVYAYRYWPTPPRSTANPTFLPILEMVTALFGTFWSLFIGYTNRQRLNSPQVKSYFLALQSGQVVVQGGSFNTAVVNPARMPVLANLKSCPNCGNSIPLEARICQYCQQSFRVEEIESAKNQLAARLAQTRAEEKEGSRQQRMKSLRVAGGIAAVLGVALMLLLGLIQMGSTSLSNNTTGFALVMLCCPTPLILLGGGLFGWQTYSLRRQKEEKKRIKPEQTWEMPAPVVKTEPHAPVIKSEPPIAQPIPVDRVSYRSDPVEFRQPAPAAAITNQDIQAAPFPAANLSQKQELNRPPKKVKELTLDRICDDLLSLLTNDFQNDDERLEKIRSIGMDLDRRGGITLMRKVGNMVQMKDPLKASWLNNAWGGIGEWMS
jgi:hypothetical protein